MQFIFCMSNKLSIRAHHFFPDLNCYLYHISNSHHLLDGGWALVIWLMNFAYVSLICYLSTNKRKLHVKQCSQPGTIAWPQIKTLFRYRHRISSWVGQESGVFGTESSSRQPKLSGSRSTCSLQGLLTWQSWDGMHRGCVSDPGAMSYTCVITLSGLLGKLNSLSQ